MVANLKVLNDTTTGSRSFSPSSCNPNGACGNGLEKIYPTSAVRYGYMNYIGEFRYAPGMLFGCGSKVVVQTSRGIEIGQQVSLTCGGCEKSIKRDTMLDYVKNSGPEFFQLKSGRILRPATAQDLEEERHINLEAVAKLRRAREVAVTQNLAMKFVACELLFGGERIIFHFMAEGRIDFRDLVRDLAHEFHTRIEMHQVGARDEARLVADYEICGRECCCKNFLKTLRPVTMRMAKLQKATLDPSKVSGRCGRLRCCLRYEHEGYEEMDKKLPRVGQRVRTDKGSGTIRDRQILTQLITVAYDDSDFVETLGVEMVVEFDVPRGPSPGPATGQAAGPRSMPPRRSEQDAARNARPPREPQRPQEQSGKTEEVDQTGTDPSADATRSEPPLQSDPQAQQPRRRRRRHRGRRGEGRDGPNQGGPGSQQNPQ
jgi:cell fate regulator YaaT (PSP1 superfamily)